MHLLLSIKWNAREIGIWKEGKEVDIGINVNCLFKLALWECSIELFLEVMQSVYIFENMWKSEVM